jgi:ArsR family transcriptional regulator
MPPESAETAAPPPSETVEDLDWETMATVCKALGHPARIRIVAYLQEIDRCVCGRIVDIMPLAQSTVSQHLKQLKKAGLIKGTVEGPCTCYCLNHGTLARFKRGVQKL